MRIFFSREYQFMKIKSMFEEKNVNSQTKCDQEKLVLPFHYAKIKFQP